MQVFPGDTVNDIASASKRAILSPKNIDVDTVNDKMFDRAAGAGREYLSTDTTVTDEDACRYPTEFLNSLIPSGFPPHQLRLKKGCPIILLRNLNPAKGLANGTRLIVEALCDRVITARIINGSDAHIGNIVFIPRVKLLADDDTLPFHFFRRQFPIRLAYALTINKSQGQSFDFVGLYLPKPVFSHGQLYVALSRVTSPGGIRILALNSTVQGRPGQFTQNIVYNEALL